MKAISSTFEPVLFYYVVQGGTTFWVYGCNPNVWPVQMKAFEKYFRTVLSLMLYKVIPTFKTAIIKILAREYSHTTTWKTRTISYHRRMHSQ